MIRVVYELIVFKLQVPFWLLQGYLAYNVLLKKVFCMTDDDSSSSSSNSSIPPDESDNIIMKFYTVSTKLADKYDFSDPAVSDVLASAITRLDHNATCRDVLEEFENLMFCQTQRETPSFFPIIDGKAEIPYPNPATEENLAAIKDCGIMRTTASKMLEDSQKEIEYQKIVHLYDTFRDKVLLRGTNSDPLIIKTIDELGPNASLEALERRFAIKAEHLFFDPKDAPGIVDYFNDMELDEKLAFSLMIITGALVIIGFSYGFYKHFQRATSAPAIDPTKEVPPDFALQNPLEPEYTLWELAKQAYDHFLSFFF